MVIVGRLASEKSMYKDSKYNHDTSMQTYYEEEPEEVMQMLHCEVPRVNSEAYFKALEVSECFKTLDSGAREEYDSGMIRDTERGKPRFDLCDKSMYLRWAELMGRGADKYGANNWRKAEGLEELDRFKSSAERHMMYWLMGREDEDHAAAVMFNIAAAEFVKSKMKGANND